MAKNNSLASLYILDSFYALAHLYMFDTVYALSTFRHKTDYILARLCGFATIHVFLIIM